jgi:hypothetical protein
VIRQQGDTDMNRIEELKSEGRYREAGALAARDESPVRNYGCHYGLRSERDAARDEFLAGFDAETARQVTRASKIEDLQEHADAIDAVADVLKNCEVVVGGTQVRPAAAHLPFIVADQNARRMDVAAGRIVRQLLEGKVVEGRTYTYTLRAR